MATLTVSNGTNTRTEYDPLTLNLETYGESAHYYYHDNDTVDISQAYGKVVGDQGELISTGNFTEFILDVGLDDISKYRQLLVAGADFSKDNSMKNLTCLYNSVPLHALPVSVNLMSNALLKHYYEDVDKSIIVINHPFPRANGPTSFSDVANNNFYNPDSFFNALSITIGMSLFVSAFLLFPLVERITNAKQVQLMTGVNPVVFWSANLTFDMILFLTSSMLLIIFLVILDSTNTWTSNGAAGTVILVLIMYGLSGIPFSYVISFWAKTPASGFTIVIVLNILAGKFQFVCV